MNVNNKPIVYIDMDGVLVDFDSALPKIPASIRARYIGQNDNIPGIFSLMEPMPGALAAIEQLKTRYNLYILSSVPWENPTALPDKMAWIRCYFGDGKDSLFYKKVIFSSAKNLNRGSILIDDRTKNGAGEFQGQLIQFGTSKFPDWKSVLDELM